MTHHLTRRDFLTVAASFTALAAFPAFPLRAAQPTFDLSIGTRTLDIHGKAATVFGITQPNGFSGVMLNAGQRFTARLNNRLVEPHLIHWHGQTPPMAQDGVPNLSQEPLAPGAFYDYDFAARPGTHWMHSHHGLAEQRLMAAPLIVRENAAADEQDVVVLLHDFTWRDPAEILNELTGGAGAHSMHGGAAQPMQPAQPNSMPDSDAHSGHNMGAMGNMGGGMMMGGMGGMMGHLHDVEYDAYLANDRTLADPQVSQVEAGGRVRLRLINGATATAFQIDLGSLEGQVVAVDGNGVQPIKGRRFPIAMGQRLDILLSIPKDGGAFPVVAVREGETARTGVILATPGAKISKVAETHDSTVAAVGLELESQLRALTPPKPRQPERHLEMILGEAPGYRWMLNDRSFGDHAPLAVKSGERVLLTFRNFTSMMHPMHLHGHHFQVVALNGTPINGAVRDTVIVPGHMGSVTVAFDADNAGEWVLHCHNLYHMAAGMMTTVRYEA
jgi:FtsP/CotA-like multicopper oxidase with cupredoxin domain